MPIALEWFSYVMNLYTYANESYKGSTKPHGIYEYYSKAYQVNKNPLWAPCYQILPLDKTWEEKLLSTTLTEAHMHCLTTSVTEVATFSCNENHERFPHRLGKRITLIQRRWNEA